MGTYIKGLLPLSPAATDRCQLTSKVETPDLQPYAHRETSTRSDKGFALHLPVVAAVSFLFITRIQQSPNAVSLSQLIYLTSILQVDSSSIATELPSLQSKLALRSVVIVLNSRPWLDKLAHPTRVPKPLTSRHHGRSRGKKGVQGLQPGLHR